jgi:hypothetical protein
MEDPCSQSSGSFSFMEDLWEVLWTAGTTTSNDWDSDSVWYEFHEIDVESLPLTYGIVTSAPW